MKIRDSGMPEETVWEGFFDPGRVLERLGFGPDFAPVADLGCGYGTFVLAAARLTADPVYAFDIDPAMVATTASRARALGLTHVRAIERDVVADGLSLADSSIGYAMLFNILHAKDAFGLLREAFRVLRPGGIAALVHWVHDESTPRGPDLSIRPRPQEIVAWARQVGFEPQGPIALPPHHFGIIGRKPLVEPSASP